MRERKREREREREREGEKKRERKKRHGQQIGMMFLFITTIIRKRLVKEQEGER